MKKIKPATLIPFLSFVIIVSIVYFLGIAAVPFHPDESTRIYTSGDAELFWQRPSSLFWSEEKSGNDRQAYRELDAPLTNYLIAVARWLTRNPPLARDWDWGKTWQENDQAGAFPSPDLLIASRTAIAFLFPLSLVFLFLTAYQTANGFTGWASALLFASNALVLLHTRRAMAEGLLLFTSVLTLWCLVRIEKKRWLISIPATFSFCAKQSLAPLIPLGLAANLWPVEKPSWNHLKHAMLQGFLYSISVVIILYLLHPFVWAQPGKALRAAIQARQALASAQIADRPDQALNTPVRKLVSMVGNLFLTQPMMAETGNYLVETRSAAQAYLSNPLHSLFRSLLAGAALLILCLFGFAAGVLQAVKEKGATRRQLVLLLAATIAQTASIFWLIPLPWQRYYLPLIPYVCLWTAFGIDRLRQAIKSGLFKRLSEKHGGSYTAGLQQ